MKKFLIWALIIVGITVGIIGAGVQFAASRLVDTGLKTAILELPENVAFDYADSDMSLLSRKMRLKQVDLTLEDENLNVKVGELTVDELQPSNNADVPLIMNGVQLKDVDIASLDTGEIVHINEIVLRDVADVAIQQITNGGEEFIMPPSLDVDLVGIQVTADMLKDQEIVLESFGYQLPLEVDVSLKYNFSESDEEFQLDKLQVGMPDVFALNLSTHMGGIDMDTINAIQNENTSDPIMSLMLAESLSLYNLNFTYTDDSFTERALTQMAEEKGISLDAFKDEMSVRIDEMTATDTNSQSNEAADALRDFINDPGELTIGINPETPLTYADFFDAILASSFGGGIDADGLAERMNITISSR